MRRLLFAFAVSALAACGDGSGPKDADVPALGRYAVSFTPGGPGAAPTPISGTATITYATADSIAVTFAVPQLEPQGKLGFKNADAYLVYGIGSNIGLIEIAAFRVKVTGSRQTLGCTGIHITSSASYPSACSLSYQGP